jgi:hypothetical protein
MSRMTETSRAIARVTATRAASGVGSVERDRDFLIALLKLDASDNRLSFGILQLLEAASYRSKPSRAIA